MAAAARMVATSVGELGGASLGCGLPGTRLVDVGAVVVTLTEKQPGDGHGGFEGVTLTVEGDSEHEPSGGAPEHESATVPLNPPDEFTSSAA